MTEEKKNLKVQCTPISKRSAAADYYTPVLNKVVTEITAEDPDFLPKIGIDTIYANLMSNSKKTVKIEPKGYETLDCGINLCIAGGYRVVAVLGNWLSRRGLFITSIETNGDRALRRLYVNVVNLGESSIEIEYKSVFAQMHLELVHLFDWRCK